MTAVNVLVREEVVHVVTDGAVYAPDGAVTGLAQKVHVLAHASAVVAARGPTFFPPAYAAALNAADLRGFDDLLAKAALVARATLDRTLAAIRSTHGDELVDEVDALSDLRRSEVVIAGWAVERNRGEVHRLDTRDAEVGLVHQPDGLIMPCGAAVQERLRATAWCLDDPADDVPALLALLEHQRAVDDEMPDGRRFRTVGGFAQHTAIRSDGIGTRILRRWSVAS